MIKIAKLAVWKIYKLVATAIRRSFDLMFLTVWGTRFAGETAADSYRCKNSTQGHVGEKRHLVPFPNIQQDSATDRSFLNAVNLVLMDSIPATGAKKSSYSAPDADWGGGETKPVTQQERSPTQLS